MGEMAAGRFPLFFLMACFLVCSSGAQTNITAELGQDVILPSKVPNKYNINNIAAEWIRPDLDPEYVLFYRDGHLDPYGQHPSYQNRVDLQDKEMKDGDASLILMNVKMEDTGTYECHVFEGKKNELISSTYLEVRPSGSKGGLILDGEDTDEGEKDRFIAGPVVGVMLVVLVSAAVGLWFYRRHRRQNPNVPPDKETAKQML